MHINHADRFLVGIVFTFAISEPFIAEYEVWVVLIIECRMVTNSCQLPCHLASGWELFLLAIIHTTSSYFYIYNTIYIYILCVIKLIWVVLFKITVATKWKTNVKKTKHGITSWGYGWIVVISTVVLITRRNEAFLCRKINNRMSLECETI